MKPSISLCMTITAEEFKRARQHDTIEQLVKDKLRTLHILSTPDRITKRFLEEGDE